MLRSYYTVYFIAPGSTQGSRRPMPFTHNFTRPMKNDVEPGIRIASRVVVTSICPCIMSKHRKRTTYATKTPKCIRFVGDPDLIYCHFLWADPMRSFNTTASRQGLHYFSPQVRRPLRTTYSIFTKYGLLNYCVMVCHRQLLLLLY